MVVADSSVWIDFFHEENTLHAQVLRALLSRQDLLVGDLILHEVLRGEGDGARRREMALFMRRRRVLPMLNTRLAIMAADNFLIRLQSVQVGNYVGEPVGVYDVAA